MKSSPLTIACFVALLWGAVGLLLPKTSAPPPTPPTAASDDTPTAAPTATWTTLRFSHPPQSASLLLGGTVLWTAPSPSAARNETELNLHPADYARLILRGTWADSTSGTAVTLSLEPDGLPTREATLWITGTADHTFPFRDAEDTP